MHRSPLAARPKRARLFLAVAAALAAPVLAQERPTANAAAYDAFLRGEAASEKMTDGDIPRLDLFFDSEMRALFGSSFGASAACRAAGGASNRVRNSDVMRSVFMD